MRIRSRRDIVHVGSLMLGLLLLLYTGCQRRTYVDRAGGSPPRTGGAAAGDSAVEQSLSSTAPSSGLVYFGITEEHSYEGRTEGNPMLGWYSGGRFERLPDDDEAAFETLLAALRGRRDLHALMPDGRAIRVDIGIEPSPNECCAWRTLLDVRAPGPEPLPEHLLFWTGSPRAESVSVKRRDVDPELDAELKKRLVRSYEEHPIPDEPGDYGFWKTYHPEKPVALIPTGEEGLQVIIYDVWGIRPDGGEGFADVVLFVVRKDGRIASSRTAPYLGLCGMTRTRPMEVRPHVFFRIGGRSYFLVSVFCDPESRSHAIIDLRTNAGVLEAPM